MKKAIVIGNKIAKDLGDAQLLLKGNRANNLERDRLISELMEAVQVRITAYIDERVGRMLAEAAELIPETGEDILVCDGIGQTYVTATGDYPDGYTATRISGSGEASVVVADYLRDLEGYPELNIISKESLYEIIRANLLAHLKGAIDNEINQLNATRR